MTRQNFYENISKKNHRFPNNRVLKTIKPISVKLIGQALKRNPFAPDVPCHRVIASNGDIGGFHGERSGDMIDRKRQLLDEEKENKND